MQKQKIVHFLNPLQNIAKPLLVLAISTLLLLSTLTTIIPNTQAQTTTPTPALNTQGHNIVDQNNNIIYLRGIGRAGDTDSLTGIWGAKGESTFNYGNKWETNTATLTHRMDQTFTAYREEWKVNMVRIFINVDWWWEDNINPYQKYGQGPDQLMSYQNYVELLIQRAQANGIYVNFVPYQVLNHYINSDKWDGIPGSLGTDSANYMRTIHNDETQAWNLWWTSVVNKIGKYSNVIFEAWNEPCNSKASFDPNQPSRAEFFNYATEMYKTIRGLQNNNLIFLQWHMSLVPTWQELDWVPAMHRHLRDSIGLEPVNVAYTAHPYRHAPYPNLQWKTTYDEVKAQLNAPNMVPATRSGDVNVPLVFNEMGVMTSLTAYSYGVNQHLYEQVGEGSMNAQQRLDRELDFWDAILRNSREMGIGVAPYYWMQTDLWGAVNQGLISSATWPSTAASPTPWRSGQIFIDNYVASSKTTPTYISTPELTPNPTVTPLLTPKPEPTQTPESVEPTTEPTPNPTPTTELEETAKTTISSNIFRFIWRVIWWPSYNWWIIYII
jgi:hypothetical protein